MVVFINMECRQSHPIVSNRVFQWFDILTCLHTTSLKIQWGFDNILEAGADSRTTLKNCDIDSILVCVEKNEMEGNCALVSEAQITIDARNSWKGEAMMYAGIMELESRKSSKHVMG